MVVCRVKRFFVFSTRPLLHVMLDSSHAAYTKNHRMWELVCRFTLDWFAGANLSSWLNKLVVGHRIYTNMADVDPDLPVNVESDIRRIVECQVKLVKFVFNVVIIMSCVSPKFY